jgi:hypothetical protein
MQAKPIARLFPPFLTFVVKEATHDYAQIRDVYKKLT